MEHVSGVLNAGDALIADGVPAGSVTSASAAHALGYVRSAFAEAGRVLSVQDGMARVVSVVKM
jgi:hypothetical protein